MDVMALYAPIKAQHELNQAWSAEQAQKAMDYQTYMSNSAHQREVEDLKKAGLNPVLSAGGSGASTTSGVAASAGDQNLTALYGLLSKSLDASIQAAQAMQSSAKIAASSSGRSGASFTVGAPLLDDGLNAVADYIYRRTGIKQEHSLPIIQAGYGKVTSLLDRAASAVFGTSARGVSSSQLSDEDKELARALKDAAAYVDNRVYYGEHPEWYDAHEPLENELRPLKSALSKVVNAFYKAAAELYGKEALVGELAKERSKTMHTK